jgi:hypothetical protein
MMRRGLFVCLAVCVCVQPARAQTRVYVTGGVFAEIMRSSRTITPDTLGVIVDTSLSDDVTLGGGGRIGAFFSPAWSLELGLDVGKTTRQERTQSIRAPIGLTIGTLPYQSRSSHRISASSVLLGYHPPSRGRIQAGFRGGVSFTHSERSYTYPTVATVFPTVVPTVPGVLPVLPAPRISVEAEQTRFISNGLTATLAAEAAIGVSDHFAIVPEMRAHAGGIGGILLRPGVAARWRW